MIQLLRNEIVSIMKQCIYNTTLLEKFIKRRNINLNDLNDKKWDLIIVAIKNFLSLEVIKFLIKHGKYKSLNYKIEEEEEYNNKINYSIPIYLAISTEQFKVADLLIQNGANINYKFYYNNEEKDLFYYLYFSDTLNKRTIEYSKDRNFDITSLKDILMYILMDYKDTDEKILKIVIDYLIFSDSLIIEFLQHYRDKKSMSNKNIINMIYKGCTNNCRSFYDLFDNKMYLFKVLLDYNIADCYIIKNIKKYDFLEEIISTKSIPILEKSLQCLFSNFKKNEMEKVFTRIFPIARNKNNEGILIEGMKLGIKKILTSYIDVSTFFYQLEEVILVLSQFNVKDVMKFLLEMFFKKGELNYGKEPDNFFNKYIVKFNDSKLLSLLLNVAIKVSDFEWVKLLLNNMKLKSTININEKDRNNEYPIFVALNHVTRYNDHIDIFNYLIELGADITVTDKFGITLLEVAIRNKKYKAVHYLLKHGIINYEINKNYSPMVNAIYQNDINTVTTILAKKTKNSKDDSPPTKKIRYQYDKYEYPPLVMAYLLHRDEIFKKLLECSDINLNELDINGCSLLHYVILKEDIETLHTLIKRGVRMDYQENDRCIGHYLSDIVLSIGNKEILSIILSSNNKNQIIHELNEYDETPLITLLKINTNLMDSNFKIDIFKYLVDCGASMEVKERNDRPLFYCVLDLASTEEENALLIVQYMIDQKYDIKNIMDETYLSPLNCAIEKGSFALMRLLLDNGADCFCWRTERNSISSLAFAISNGYIEPTKYLIQYLNEKNKSLQRYTGVSKISLINSIENPKTRITMLEYFLKSGLISLKHLKPSRVIQMVKHYDTMEETYDLFFKHGLDINFVDGIDGTLITNAIEESKDALLDYFLKKKINLSLYCYNSQFIEYIIKKNHFKIFKQLIQRKLPYSQIGLIVLAIKLKNFPISKYLIQRMNNMNETDKETILFYITKHKENRTFYYRMYKLLNNQYKKCLKRYE